MEKTKKRDSVKAARVQKTAELTGVTEQSVYRVIRGDQENPIVEMVYMELLESEQTIVEAIRQLVPQKSPYEIRK